MKTGKLHSVCDTGGGEKHGGLLWEHLRRHHWLSAETFPVSEGADQRSAGGGGSSASDLTTVHAGEGGGTEEEDFSVGAFSTDRWWCQVLAGTGMTSPETSPESIQLVMSSLLCLYPVFEGMAVSAAPLWKRWSSLSSWCLRGSTPPFSVYKESCWWAGEATQENL